MSKSVIHTNELCEGNRQEIARLKADNVRLRAKHVQLTASNIELTAMVSKLKAENRMLVERLATVERSLGLNSTNSGKPPSSDGLKKPGEKSERRTRSLRGKSDRKSGGQPGHKGETLCQSESPDHVESYFPPNCVDCGLALTVDMTQNYRARQVFDLPPPSRLEVTEHRAYSCGCKRCGSTTSSAFPQSVSAPVQYGPRIAGFVTYLRAAHFLPEQRLTQIMFDMFKVSLSKATLAAMVSRMANKFSGFAEHVRDLIVGTCRVKHLDETGLRVAGKTQWLHVACTPLLSFFRVGRRGMLLDGVSGCVVHDHWKPYFKLKGVVHALCNAHHLRELQALVEIEKEDWPRRMQVLLNRANRITKLANDKEQMVHERLLSLIYRQYDRIVCEALDFHEKQPPLSPPGKRGRKKRRPGHNLARRLCDHKDDVLRFLIDPDVPFTNNQAEQDIRMGKLQQKISGGFRSQEGAEEFATMRTIISTARKQGWNILEILSKSPNQLIADLRYE